MAFIAGQYTATLVVSTPVTLGQMTNGITLEHQAFGQDIIGDNQGDTPQDSVFRGMSVHGNYVLMEYDAAAAAGAMWPYGTAYLTMGVVGRMDVASSMVAQLVMTAIAGTPAAAAPASVTFPLAILAKGFPVGLLFAPAHRVIPIRQRFYPNSSGVFGTLT